VSSAREADTTDITGHHIALHLPGDVVDRVPWSVPRLDLELADGDLLAVADDLQLP